MKKILKQLQLTEAPRLGSLKLRCFLITWFFVLVPLFQKDSNGFCAANIVSF